MMHAHPLLDFPSCDFVLATLLWFCEHLDPGRTRRMKDILLSLFGAFIHRISLITLESQSFAQR